MRYLLSVLFLGLMGIAVPNLDAAADRSKLKRTTADMRAIATAWEARAQKRGHYSVEDVRDLPRTDGWGTPFEIHASGNDYSIRSYGSDRHRDGGDDIVYANGAFVAYPVGE